MLHSEICGSKPTYGSPQLIAVSHVLLRLSVPRHSPCALCSLTISEISLVLLVMLKLLFRSLISLIVINYLLITLKLNCSIVTFVNAFSFEFCLT